MTRTLTSRWLDLRSVTLIELLAVLVAVDVISKLAAFLLLPEGRNVPLDALLQFVLRKNETGVALWTQAQRHDLPGGLAAVIGLLVLAFALIKIRGQRLGLWRRVVVGIVAYFVPFMLALPAAEALVKFSQPLSVVAARGGTIVFIGTIWWFLPTGLSKLGLTLLMAAAVGNLLSLLYPPFRIIDFVYLRLTAKRYVIFNVADLYVPVGLVCLIVAAAQYVVRRFRRSRDSPRCP